MDERHIAIEQGWHRSRALEVATLYELAFGHKFQVAIPSQAQRIHLLAESFNPEYSFVATQKNKIVGIAGFQTPEGSLTGGITLKSLFRVLGFWQGIRAAAILSLFERQPVSGEMIMDGIAVDPACRGAGIGSALLSSILAFADEDQYLQVRLDVIDSNPRARKLYTEKGFVAIKSESFPFLKRLIGFSGSTTMIYHLRGD
ncbi:GNAT family N-acetyltransferase [Photobacterium sp. 1_MG-2023]|uniref:GNAT family N-acetyltransferase n=1 Tax=Photobacterium sp. 1_MG-2023 TaxID=3062646 RepID=UPI0026E2B8C3|nr:GNAT family N-acetyltransferase [Photobacterium sp. 1_MG-2023]MDO6707530.1 GNAT family N-acetyltransferase [Photobacterium sp. 1_MG-2023]